MGRCQGFVRALRRDRLKRRERIELTYGERKSSSGSYSRAVQPVLVPIEKKRLQKFIYTFTVLIAMSSTVLSCLTLPFLSVSFPMTAQLQVAWVAKARGSAGQVGTGRPRARYWSS